MDFLDYYSCFFAGLWMSSTIMQKFSFRHLIVEVLVRFIVAASILPMLFRATGVW